MPQAQYKSTINFFESMNLKKKILKEEKNPWNQKKQQKKANIK